MVPRSLWNLPGLLVGMELCISMSGKKNKQKRLCQKGKSSAFMTPLCVHRCFLPVHPPFAGAHGPQTDGKWLMVDLRARLVGKGGLAWSRVGVSLGRGPTWGLASAVPSGQP